MHLFCVILDQKVKIVISNRNWDGVFQKYGQPLINMQRLKKAGSPKGMFSHFLFPLFMVWLEFKAYGDEPHILRDAE